MFFFCSLHAVYPAVYVHVACMRLARQPEARVCPRAVLPYVTLRIRAQLKYLYIAGCAAEGATSFEFETATTYNCHKTFGRGGSIYSYSKEFGGGGSICTCRVP